MTTMTVNRSSNMSVASMGRRFLLNASFGLLTRIAHLAASLFLVAYLLRHLGLERFGLVVTSATIVAFLSLIQSGAASGMGRQFNRLWSKGDLVTLRRHYSAGLALSGLVAAAIGIGLALLLTVLWSWTAIPEALAPEGRRVLAMLGLASVVTCLALPANACLQAAHRVDLIEKAQLAGIVLRIGGAVALFGWAGASAALYAAILLAEQCLVAVVTASASRKVLPEISFQHRGIDTALLREVAGFNALNLIANVNYVAFMQIPALLLVRFDGLAMAGLYGVSLQLNNLLRGLLQPVVGALSPVANSLHATDRGAMLQHLFLLATKCFVGIALLVWTLFYFLGAPLLQLWLQRDMGPLIAAFPWLIGTSAIGVAAMPASIFAVALGRVRLPAVSGLLLAAGMTLMLALTAESRDWAPALVRTALGLLLFFGIYQLVRVIDVASVLGVSCKALLRIAGIGAFPSLAAAAVLAILLPWMHPQTAGALGVVLSISVTAAGLTVCCGFFNTAERDLITRLVSTAKQAGREEERE